VDWSTLVALKSLSNVRRARCDVTNAASPSQEAQSCGSRSATCGGQRREREGDPESFRPTCVAADAASGEQDHSHFGFQMQKNVFLFKSAARLNSAVGPRQLIAPLQPFLTCILAIF
jgi:hypothetical protein